MDALAEIYRMSPDWLKLVIVLQPTLCVWAPLLFLLLRRMEPGDPEMSRWLRDESRVRRQAQLTQRDEASG